MASRSKSIAAKPSRRRSAAVSPAGYDEFLSGIKARIAASQTRAALAVTRELLELYYRLGAEIVMRQERDGWGSAVIERLARDLQAAFPGVEGFSRTNLERMRAFFRAYGPAAIPPHAVGELVLPESLTVLPWGHHAVLIEKVKDRKARDWYAAAALAHGWSRAILVHHIEAKLHARQGTAITNFSRTLPSPDSDLATTILKDPYNFEFLTLDRDAKERALERGLLENIRSFMLELGTGFAFVGSQVPLRVGDREFFLDLLFYHLKLRRYVIVELKIGTLEPEHVGKLNFYLSAADEQLRGPDDGPTVGLLICKDHERFIAEYALRDVHKPVGIARYRTNERLPPALAEALPSLGDLTMTVREPLSPLTPLEEIVVRRHFGIGQPTEDDLRTIAKDLGKSTKQIERVLERGMKNLARKLLK